MQTALGNLINTNHNEKTKRGIDNTPFEIANQIELWEDTFKRVLTKREEILTLLNQFNSYKHLGIIITGAGSSEYAGKCFESLIRKKFQLPVNTVSSTSLVTTPEDTFFKDSAVLIISLARSGSSPESLGAVETAEMISDNVFHIAITCNGEGELAKLLAGKNNSSCVILDEKTNDKGLAMTSSFSNMVIGGQSLAYLENHEEYAELIPRIIQAGKNIVDMASDTCQEICTLPFSRAIFLGNGSNLGTAIESHLKLQELTSGEVMCSFETFLGFRHGPEALLNSNSLVVAFISSDPFLRRYEEDLLTELKEKKLGLKTVVVCGNASSILKKLADFVIEYDPEGMLLLPDIVTPPVNVIIGQMLGLFKSLDLGYKPDSPSNYGIINRIVEGVKVYSLREFRKNGEFKIVAER